MGGIVGLTFRWPDGTQWRGSCWTNVLPDGLFAPPFFVRRASEGHARRWLANILKNRDEAPEIGKLWGSSPLLAPVEYGLVVVDFKTKTVLSHQGYSNPFQRYYIPRFSGKSPAAWRARGVRVRDISERRMGNGRKDVTFSVVSFWKQNVSLMCGAATRRAVKQLGFTLTAAERKQWREYIGARRG